MISSRSIWLSIALMACVAAVLIRPPLDTNTLRERVLMEYDVFRQNCDLGIDVSLNNAYVEATDCAMPNHARLIGSFSFLYYRIPDTYVTIGPHGILDFVMTNPDSGFLFRNFSEPVYAFEQLNGRTCRFSINVVSECRSLRFDGSGFNAVFDFRMVEWRTLSNGQVALKVVAVWRSVELLAYPQSIFSSEQYSTLALDSTSPV